MFFLLKIACIVDFERDHWNPYISRSQTLYNCTFPLMTGFQLFPLKFSRLLRDFISTSSCYPRRKRHVVASSIALGSWKMKVLVEIKILIFFKVWSIWTPSFTLNVKFLKIWNKAFTKYILYTALKWPTTRATRLSHFQDDLSFLQDKWNGLHKMPNSNRK